MPISFHVSALLTDGAGMPETDKLWGNLVGWLMVYLPLADMSHPWSLMIWKKSFEQMSWWSYQSWALEVFLTFQFLVAGIQQNGNQINRYGIGIPAVSAKKSSSSCHYQDPIVPLHLYITILWKPSWIPEAHRRLNTQLLIPSPCNNVKLFASK